VPVVKGRDAILRVFVKPDTEWTPRNVVARLDMTQKGKTVPARTVTRMVTAASVDGDLTSTFNFELPGAEVTEDLTYAVSLREAKITPGVKGTKDGALYPATGKEMLGARSAGAALKIVIVPIQYLADGSSRLPDTSQAALDRLRTRMLSMYPTPTIQMSVRSSPLDLQSYVQRSGAGWSEMLNAVLAARSQDGAPNDVYYYGMVQPASSFTAYCSGGCVAGLSALAGSADDAFSRGSVGLGYGDDDAEETFVHEVGHAHGRRHAPCGGAQGTDTSFPYPGAGIGVWGYDARSKTLIDPESTYRDMMGYCKPSWLSDYTYNALFERIAAVNTAARVVGGAPSTWRILLVDGDGRATRGELVTLATPPSSEPVTLELRDESGATARTVTGQYYPYSHLPGGMLLVPRPGDEGLHVERMGERVPL